MVFSEPLTEQDLYWAGLLSADGSMIPPAKIQLRLVDVEMVEGLKKFLGFGSVIYLENPVRLGRIGKRCAHFGGSSHSVFNALVSLGVVPKKSHILQVSQALAREASFWRGAFDGDGSLTLQSGKYLQLGFCSSSAAFIGQFAGFLLSLGIVATPSMRILPSGLPHYYIQLMSRRAITFCKAIYADPCTLYMQRKKAIFDQYLLR